MRKKLQRQSEKIESILGQHGIPARVTGGTVTPRWVRFQVLPAVGSRISKIKRLNEELADALDAKDCRVAWRGAVFDATFTHKQAGPVRLKALMAQLDPRDVPPLCAVLGVASDDGVPLLARLPGEEVGNITAPRELLGVIATSLAMRNGPDVLAIVTDMPELAHWKQARYMAWREAVNGMARLVKARARSRERWPIVVGVLSHEGADGEILRDGPSVGVHVIEARDEPGLVTRWPAGLTIAERNAHEMVAIDRTGWRHTFYPATLGEGEDAGAAVTGWSGYNPPRPLLED